MIYADIGEESINCPECGKPIYVPRAVILFEEAFPTKGVEEYERPKTVAPPVLGERKIAVEAKKEKASATNAKDEKEIIKSSAPKEKAEKTATVTPKPTESTDVKAGVGTVTVTGTGTGTVTVTLKHSASPFSPADGSTYVLGFGGLGVKLVSGKQDVKSSLSVLEGTYQVTVSVYGYEDKNCRKQPVWVSKPQSVTVVSGKTTTLEIHPGKFFNAPTLAVTATE